MREAVKRKEREEMNFTHFVTMSLPERNKRLGNKKQRRVSWRDEWWNNCLFSSAYFPHWKNGVRKRDKTRGKNQEEKTFADFWYFSSGVVFVWRQQEEDDQSFKRFRGREKQSWTDTTSHFSRRRREMTMNREDPFVTGLTWRGKVFFFLFFSLYLWNDLSSKWRIRK